MDAAFTKTVSVIVPFYSELGLIERAVNSVLVQNLPADVKVEVVLGNDSLLNQCDIRQALSDSSNGIVRIVNNHNDHGAGNARNAALESAHSELIAFLDADDYWLPDRLARQMSLIESGANFVAGSYRFEDRRKTVSPPKKVASVAESLKKLGVGTSTVLVRRDLLGENRFMNLRFSQDTEMWARLAGRPGFVFASVPEVIAVYAPSSRTSNKFIQLFAFRKVVRQFRLSLVDRVEIYLRYTVRGMLNHYIRR
jgi:teichuronic acid biosynthesis glycosyltransferase TuaG